MKKHVLIGIPSNSDWKADFGLCLTNMCMATLKHGDKEVTVASSKGSMLPRQRHDLVIEAKAVGATHLLFLDCDMIFPNDTLDQLLFWEKPVVAANYVVKVIPSVPVTRVWKDDKWEIVFTTKTSENLEEVHRVGTGVLLLDMKVFDTLRQPWFPFPWCGDEDLYQGEDWTFCERLEEAGFPLYIDHNVSKEVGHVGNLTYKHGHVRPEYIVKKKGEKFRKWEDRGMLNSGGLY